jgi:DNA polymerase III delta prime subunit
MPDTCRIKNEVIIMKKATDMNELANNLIPENFLKPEDKDVYVPIYEDILANLRNMLINDQVESQTFFVAGQAGTGKTTALNFFRTDTLEKHYHIKYINMRDYLDLSDVDIIDFLLAFAFALVKDSPIEDKYYKQLEEIRQKHEGEIEKIEEEEKTRKTGRETMGEGSVGGGFFNFLKLKAQFFINLRMDTSYRKYTRKIFNLKKPFLHKLINELIDDYIEKVSKGKSLLVIIDDLDKMKEVGQINSIFIESRNYIFSLKCKKIISIPTYLSRTPEISNYSQHPIRQFILRLTPNPFDKEMRPGEEVTIKNNHRLMRQVIKIRIAGEHVLIDENALNKAVENSGGIIRQLIKIVRVAAVEVRTLNGKKISLHDVEEAISQLRNEMADSIISSDKINLLNTVLTKNIPETKIEENFVGLLLANNVLSYKNGDPWYEVNPLIKDTVKVYASRQEEEKPTNG